MSDATTRVLACEPSVEPPSAGKHLSGGCGLGKGVFAVHILHEIFAEGNEKEYTKNAAEERAQEYLKEVDRDLGIGGLKDVEGGGE